MVKNPFFVNNSGAKTQIKKKQLGYFAAETTHLF